MPGLVSEDAGMPQHLAALGSPRWSQPEAVKDPTLSCPPTSLVTPPSAGAAVSQPSQRQGANPWLPGCKDIPEGTVKSGQDRCGGSAGPA